MLTANNLLRLMQELLVYTKASNFDIKIFGQKSKNIADIYKKCSQEVQGDYHHKWSEWLKSS